jgi:hypothetical protein
MSRLFNASIFVNESLTPQITNIAMDLAIRCVMECSLKYGFDGDEALYALGLKVTPIIPEIVEPVIIEQVIVEPVIIEPVIIEPAIIEPAIVEPAIVEPIIQAVEQPKVNPDAKVKITLPFNCVINNNVCLGLKLNHSLYTQCESKRMNGLNYCKSCAGQTDKNSNGKPDYGTVSDRMLVGLMDYKDPKGKGPIHYTKFMKKMNITQEEVINEALKLNITIDPIHFTEPEIINKPKQDGKKGKNPKNDKVIDVDNVTDLFAKIVIMTKIENDNNDNLDDLPDLEIINDDVIVEDIEPVQNVQQEVEVKEPKEKKEKVVKEPKEKKEKVVKEPKVKADKEPKAGKKTKQVKFEPQHPVVLSQVIINKIKTPQAVVNDDDSLNVTNFEYDGVIYFKTTDNLLYNETYDLVGKITQNNDVVFYTGDDDYEEETEDTYDFE